MLASTDEYENEGIKKGVPWSNGLLWAPDVTKRGEWYYFYFCLSDGTEGVAKSKNPYGPFEDAVQITMGGKPIEGIDPSVLEDDGKYYYTWGQGLSLIHIFVISCRISYQEDSSSEQL